MTDVISSQSYINQQSIQIQKGINTHVNLQKYKISQMQTTQDMYKSLQISLVFYLYNNNNYNNNNNNYIYIYLTTLLYNNTSYKSMKLKMTLQQKIILNNNKKHYPISAYQLIYFKI